MIVLVIVPSAVLVVMLSAPATNVTSSATANYLTTVAFNGATSSALNMTERSAVPPDSMSNATRGIPKTRTPVGKNQLNRSDTTIPTIANYSTSGVFNGATSSAPNMTERSSIPPDSSRDGPRIIPKTRAPVGKNQLNRSDMAIPVTEIKSTRTCSSGDYVFAVYHGKELEDGYAYSFFTGPVNFARAQKICWRTPGRELLYINSTRNNDGVIKINIKIAQAFQKSSGWAMYSNSI